MRVERHNSRDLFKEQLAKECFQGQISVFCFFPHTHSLFLSIFLGRILVLASDPPSWVSELGGWEASSLWHLLAGRFWGVHGLFWAETASPIGASMPSPSNLRKRPFLDIGFLPVIEVR